MKELLAALAELVPEGKNASELLKQRLLGSVSRPRLRFAPLFGPLSELFDLGDIDLAGLFERAAKPEEWVSAPVPGVQLLHLTGGPRVAHADNGLVRLAAGVRFPRHRHLGNERVLVLQGGYVDEPSGRVYTAGAVHEMAEGSEHAYHALEDGELLLAVSLVTGVDVEGYGALTPSAQR
jgi:quercetin dioxygenase-like cupin family protein